MPFTAHSQLVTRTCISAAATVAPSDFKPIIGQGAFSIPTRRFWARPDARPLAYWGNGQALAIIWSGKFAGQLFLQDADGEKMRQVNAARDVLARLFAVHQQAGWWRKVYWYEYPDFGTGVIPVTNLKKQDRYGAIQIAYTITEHGEIVNGDKWVGRHELMVTRAGDAAPVPYRSRVIDWRNLLAIEIEG